VTDSLLRVQLLSPVLLGRGTCHEVHREWLFVTI